MESSLQSQDWPVIILVLNFFKILQFFAVNFLNHIALTWVFILMWNMVKKILTYVCERKFANVFC